jgi:oxaloacetate decarboxylase alpha subunit/pyruvate carboxylase subunit B
VGIQTVNNVLFDDENERYKMITGQVKDLCYGLYGKTAVPINTEVQKKALKGYERGEEPITCRPAEVLEPELEKAKEEIGDLAVDMDDLVLYAIYPVTGKKFLQWKYGKEEPPAEVQPMSLETALAKEELIKQARKGEVVPKSKLAEQPEKSENTRTFNVFIDDEVIEVGVDEVGGSPVLNYIQAGGAIAPAPAAAPAAPAAPAGPAPAAPKPAAPAPAAPAPAATAAAPKAAAPAAVGDADGTPLTAPMPGMIVKYEKEVGDSVEKGETVLILEAMKMENALPAPVSGTIKAIGFSSGDSVAKNAVLAVIG